MHLLCRVFATTAVAALAATLPSALSVPAQADFASKFQVPFACNERWEGSTRASHSPSPYSVDFNRDANDYGHIVVAAETGVVTSVVNLGDQSYGLYVIVDHGGGWTTLYAHLSASLVVSGQRVDQGQPIALLGNSGGSFGAHLHFEERYNKVDRAAVFNGANLVYNSWLRSRNCGDVPITGDWNGDRVSDAGVFSRTRYATFRQRNADGAVTNIRLGVSSDAPITGDWNGDGQTDLGFRTTTTRMFTLRNSHGTTNSFTFGDSNDVPVTGDWNGDGRWDVGVYDPATTTFLLRDSSGLKSSKRFGVAGGVPITGDWDGDGRWNLGYYTPSDATYTLQNVDGTTTKVVFGEANSIPVVGDWNADSVSDLGAWSPSTGTYTFRLTPRRTATLAYGKAR